MTTPGDSLVRLEVRLLVLRYGRRKLVETIANLDDKSIEDIEKEISAAEARRLKKGSQTISTPDLIKKSFHERPELIPVIERLMSRYENKTFLPQLRDVQRFVDRVGATHGRLKSRQAAIP